MKKVIALFLLAFMAAAPAAFAADEPAANMSDEALASYIQGRLDAALKDQGYQVSQACDASGCSVIVQ